MPLYEYACPECGTKFEKLVFSHGERHRTKTCPNCNCQKAERLISSPASVSRGKTAGGASSSSSCGSSGSGFS